MLFNSFAFLFVFLPITYVVFWMLPRASARYIWLAVTGYVFYSYWNPWFCLLMAFSTLVSYLAGIGFLTYTSPRARKLCLVVPITIDLLLLGFFKYANFGLETAQSMIDAAGLSWQLPKEVLVPFMDGWQLKFRDIILPVGISFYTFHTISYIVDAYRKVITPTRNFFEFAAYVSLFSQLVAGPIVRFRQIEEDLENLGAADRTRWLPIGVAYFIYGFAEKVLLADTLAGFADPAFKAWDQLSTRGAWSAVLAYTFQLYFDFSGYSSMAMGLGYMFGLRIPINFNSPYKATDPSDFWQRWHISLSSCLRDYVYIPLGGNRHGEWNAYRNLMLTMLIGGLWHGANWTFIIWGAYHGLLLALYRACAPWWDRLPRLARQLAMFFAAVIGWVYFRVGSIESADSLAVANHLIATMFTPTPGGDVTRPDVFLLILAIAAWWAMIGPNVHELTANFAWRPRHAFLFAAIFGAALALIAGGRNSPFLYFQF
jgi:alginate O-acetyltransferase complex protein AlgI